MISVVLKPYIDFREHLLRILARYVAKITEKQTSLHVYLKTFAARPSLKICMEYGLSVELLRETCKGGLFFIGFSILPSKSPYWSVEEGH